MKPATGWAHKGEAVEEWADLRFFRPAGGLVARAAARTPLSADHLTLACVVLGILAAGLEVPADWRLNAAGVALFILSDVLDSADGQLARLRGSSSRFGRLLDATGDSLRFGALYLGLAVRMVLAGAGPAGVLLAVAAGWSHAMQAAIADYLRQFHCFIAGAQAGELDLPEDLTSLAPRTWLERLPVSAYQAYIRRQVRLCPWSTRAARLLRAGEAPGALPATWAAAQRRPLGALAWIGLNIRFVLLALLVVPGWPAALCWVTIVPLNLIAAGLLLAHERTARRILGGDEWQAGVRAGAA